MSEIVSDIVVFSTTDKGSKEINNFMNTILKKTFTSVKSPEALWKSLIKDPIKAIILDNETSVNLSIEDKGRLSLIAYIIPMIVLKQNYEKTGVGHIEYADKQINLSKTIPEIMEFSYDHAVNDGTRTHYRIPLILNLKVTLPDGTTFLTNSYNISRNGVFVISPNPLPDSQSLMIEINEASKSLTKISATTLWHCPWGTSLRMPGAGCKWNFKNNSEAFKMTHFLINFLVNQFSLEDESEG